MVRSMPENSPAPRCPSSASPFSLPNIAFIALAILIASVLALRFVHPRRYVARVTMEVKPFGKFDPQFIASTMNELRDPQILDPVIEQLHLTQEFARDGKPLSVTEARQQLLEGLRIEGVRNTGLIEVGVRDSDPQRAANIANTISIVYRNHRLDAMQQAMKQELTQFEAEVAEQRKRVEEAYKAAAELRAKFGLPDAEEPANVPAEAPKPTPPASEFPPDYVQAKARYVLSKRVLEAAEMRYSTARMEQTIDQEPLHIWEKAMPPPFSEPFWK
jgi:hypothetical protein